MLNMKAGVRLGLSAIGIALVVLAAGACSGDTPDGAVHVLRADTDVGPVMEQYIDRGISRAENNNARAVVIELDTPGGLSTSMRDIVQRIERAKVPVIVYVSPSGARAASAGTFITMAANIAAMAPNTSIGAASAVNANGSDIGGNLGKKVENDAVSFIRGIAELRGRNADWAEQAVRDAVSANQSQALQLQVVDLQAGSLEELLSTIDGRDTKTGAGQPVKLEGIAAAPIVRTDMTVWERILDFIADPTVASLLITLGFLGLIFELANPGLILPGVAGAIAIVLGFIGFGTLPVHTAGLVLIGLALVFFAVELIRPSGFLAAGGIVALILGSIIAFRGTPAAVQPPLALVIALGAAFAVLFSAILSMAVWARRQAPALTGAAALVGRLAVARSPLTPEGYVFIQGERWRATLDDGSADEGDRVRVTGVEGFRLKVHKEENP
ncbi:MAG: nodulation protein NfeD [Chloroflexi bacterium]|nr:nodulation protein NfeD [Chloroflexota bacterium]